MSLPRKAWGWWGEEGGHRLDLERLADGKVLVTVTTAQVPPVTMTLANFRVEQLRQWLEPEAEQVAG